MSNAKKEMFELMAKYISKSDVYAAAAIAKVAAFIYKYRQDKKMTQKDFAQMMGVTQSMVSKWESAEYNFTIENIAQISEKLDVTFEIEFIPEKEYLVNHSKSEYIKSPEIKQWSAPIIAVYNQAA